MKTFTAATECGCNVAVRFLTDSIARIQAYPRHAEFTDSALNRYHFITEPDQAGDIQECSESGRHSWSSGELSISCDGQGRISCKDANGRPFFDMNDLKLTKKAAYVSFKAQDDDDSTNMTNLLWDIDSVIK